MRHIYITVEPYAGSSISQVARDTIELADKLGVSIFFKFNGISLVASPDEISPKNFRTSRICEEYVRKMQLADTY